MVKILFLYANPYGTEPLAISEELHIIQRQLNSGVYREHFEPVAVANANASDLLQALRAHQPTIVHFSGHGHHTQAQQRQDSDPIRRDIISPTPNNDTPDHASLILQLPSGEPCKIPASVICETFGSFARPPRVVVLNACYSDEIAAALCEVAECVVGVRSTIADSAAVEFSRGFYSGLADGESIEHCYRQGRANIGLQALPDGEKPSLHCGKRGAAGQITFFERDAFVHCGEELRSELATYLDAWIAHTSRTFPVLEGSTTRPTTMHDFYVKPGLIRKADKTPFPTDSLLSSIAGKGVYSISAPAGHGKTSLLNWLVYSLAMEARARLRAGESPHRIPIVFRQSAWKLRGTAISPHPLGVAELLTDYPALERWLTGHKAVLSAFIDGIGERASDGHQGDPLESDAAAFASWSQGLTSIVATHRGDCVFLEEQGCGLSLSFFDSKARAELLSKLVEAEVKATPPPESLSRMLSDNPLYYTLACLSQGTDPIETSSTGLLTRMAERMISARFPDGDRVCQLFLLYERISWALLQQRMGVELGARLEELVADARFNLGEVFSPGLLRTENNILSKARFLHDSFMECFAAGEALRMLERNEANLHEVVKTLGADGISHLINRLEKDEPALRRLSRLIFQDLTIQQYLYDCGALHAASSALERICALPDLPISSRLLLLKLRAHAMYGADSASHPQAIQALDRLLEQLDQSASSLPTPQQGLVLWYRIWAIDHRKNLAAGGEGEGEVEALLPTSLREGDEPLPGDELLILRAAHYWGHRGNQELRRKVKREPLRGDPIVFYLRAAAYRAYTVRYSLAKQSPSLSRLDSGALIEMQAELRAVGLPHWALNFEARPGDAEVLMECFPSMHQAIGDIAHQLVCSGIVHCWDARAEGRAAALPRARARYEAARRLWRLANEVGRERERIRYVLRLAELRAVLSMLESPASSEQEASVRLAESLSEIRKQFRAAALVDVRAMEGMTDAVLEFHRSLELAV